MIGNTLDRLNALFDRRFVARPSWIVLVEIFLGIGWLRAALAKAVERDWWTGTTIANFVGEHEQVTIGWYRPLLDRVVVGHGAVWAVGIVLLEVAIAASILTTKRLGLGLATAMFLNVNFMLVGAPNPSIFYLMLQLSLVLWLLETAPSQQTSMRWLRLFAISGAVLVLACVPSIGTLDPRTVIDDPASVLATWAACTSIAAIVARRRVRREQLRTIPIDLVETTSNKDPVYH